ncbi:MAG: hypothetical protein ACRDEA_12420, partial [Microcystaceae cyanobacterium]
MKKAGGRGQRAEGTIGWGEGLTRKKIGVRFVLEKPRNGGILGSNKVIQFGLSSHFHPLLDDNWSTLWVRALLKS